MSKKISNFADLGLEYKKKEMDTFFKELDNGNYCRAVEISKSIKNFDEIPKTYREKLGEAYYAQAKNIQYHNNHICVEYLKKSIHFKRNFPLAAERQKLIESRIKLYDNREIYHGGKKLIANRYKILNSQLTEFRNNLKITCWIDCNFDGGEGFYNCAKCKKMVKTPYKELKTTQDIEKILKVGIYKWKGDKKASETYSTLLRSFKSNNEILGKYFANLLGNFLEINFPSLKFIDFITCVPADPIRWSSRGYNPPSVIGKELSKFICIPFFDKLIEKVPSERAKNLTFSQILGNYKVIKDTNRVVSGRNVLLIDDIVTRGYTLSSCAKILKEKLRAKSVVGAVLAQSVPSL